MYIVHQLVLAAMLNSFANDTNLLTSVLRVHFFFLLTNSKYHSVIQYI